MHTETIQESYETRFAREREEEEKANTKTRALLRDVCRILKFIPEPGEEDTWRHVSFSARKGSEAIRFLSNVTYLKDRIEISGVFPRTRKGEYIDPYSYKEKSHKITVSANKSAEKIAKDIESRFFPRYRELLKRVLERVEDSDKHEEECRKNLEDIKGEKLTEGEERSHTLSLEGESFGSLTVYGDSCHFEMHSLPVHLAKKIAALVKGRV